MEKSKLFTETRQYIRLHGYKIRTVFTGLSSTFATTGYSFPHGRYGTCPEYEDSIRC
ncbi:hypothetical protein V6259_07900 [Marinomonas sp. TI.3.20]|uniref:hypothetical protein n=1 Tax=Marinomonas sp. TI.3.20 TaxID=3121296 RepID=UPI00311E0348